MLDVALYRRTAAHGNPQPAARDLGRTRYDSPWQADPHTHVKGIGDYTSDVGMAQQLVRAALRTTRPEAQRMNNLLTNAPRARPRAPHELILEQLMLTAMASKRRLVFLRDPKV